MLRILLSVCLLSLYAGQTYASKARLEALGEERTYGSYWIDDARNIFYNPALINKYKDMISFEWGADTTNTQDTADTPRGEGGYIAETRSLVYGLWFGRESDTTNQLRSIANANMPGDDNKFEFFIGGDAGVQWGASISYSSSKDEVSATNSKSSASTGSFGIVSGNSEYFATFSLANDAEYGTDEFDGKFSGSLGYIQKLRDYKVYTELRHIAFDFGPGAAAEFTSNSLLVGFAKSKSLNEKAKIFTSLEVAYAMSEVEITNSELTTIQLPLSIGFEYEAKKWMMLRGSVTQTLFSTNEATNFTVASLGAAGTGDYMDPNTNSIGMGAGFKLDGLDLDLGFSADSNDSFSSRASLTYNY